MGAVVLDPHRPAYVPADLVPADALRLHTLRTARTPAGRGAGPGSSSTPAGPDLGVPLALDH